MRPSVVLAVLLLAGAASARGRSQCRQLQDQAMALYERGEFESSLREFQRSFDVCRLPPLLLNITKLNLKLGQLREARETYDQYRRLDPEPPETLRAELKVLEEQLAVASGADEKTEQKGRSPSVGPGPLREGSGSPRARQGSPSAGPVVTETRVVPAVDHELTSALGTKAPAARPLHQRWWLWTTIGLVTAGAAVGIGVGVSQANRPPTATLGLLVVIP